MAATITFNPSLTGVGKYNASAGISSLADQINLGQNSFGVTLPQLAYGTAATYTAAGNALLVNDWYTNTLTIAGSGSYNLNFNGSSPDLNPFGVALAWASVKMVIIAVQSPDGINVVRVGPNNVALAAALWFGAVTANVWSKVAFTSIWVAPPAGWPVVAATTCKLPIANPGATSVTVAVFAAGVRA